MTAFRNSGSIAPVPFFFALLALYCLGIFSLLLANRLYIDDIGRALYGYAGWFTSARPVAELFSYLFYMGGITLDASPFSQILGVAFLAGTAFCLCLALRAPLTPGTLLAALPVGLSPYGLENLSYRFDSAQMCLALLLAVLPYCFLRRNRKTFFIASVVCLFCSASIYQPALSAYLAVGCYSMLLHTVSRKRDTELVRVFFRLALPFCLAMVLTAAQTPFWLGRTLSPYIHHVSAMPSLAELPAGIIANCRIYMKILLADWSGNPLGWLLAVLVVCFAAFLVGRWRRRRSAVRFVVLCLLFVCFLLTPAGLVAVLPHPVWAPRAFCGFGTALALMLFALRGAARGKTARRLFGVLSVLLCLQLIIFAQAYGNVLTAQERWERTRIAFLAEGITRFIAETDGTEVIFKNSVGLSPLAEAPVRQYPLLAHLAVVPIARGWEWGYLQLKLYGVHVQQPDRVPEPGESLEIYLDTPVYRLERTVDGLGVISFKSCREETLWRHAPAVP